MNRKILYIPLVLFLLLAAALMWQLTRNAQGDDPTRLESALIGKPVPVFRLESLEQPGKTYDRSVLVSGKPVLLNVWATWCPTCRAEHQYLNTLAIKGIRVVGLTIKTTALRRLTGSIPWAILMPLACTTVTGCWGWIWGFMAHQKLS